MRLMFSTLVFLVLAGCRSLPGSKNSLPGVYYQEGVFTVFHERIELSANDSFTLTVFAFLFDPSDHEEEDRWANRISGSWEFVGGVIVLNPREEKDENPGAPIGLNPRRFKIERGLNHIRLIDLDSKGELSFRK